MKYQSFPFLCGLGLVALTFVACSTSEREARQHLEASGCTKVELQRKDSHSFSFKANCDGKDCEGSLELRDSSHSSTQICHEPKPPAPTGKVLVGKGGVTGLCSKTRIQTQLQSHLSQLVACYQKDLETSPKLEGTLTLAWSIDGKGRASVDPFESSLGLVDCMRGVVGAAQWEKPEEGTCEVRWTLAVYTQEPREDLGHERLPSMDTCTRPAHMRSDGAAPKIQLGEFLKKEQGTWELRQVNLWTGRVGSQENAFQVRVDRLAEGGRARVVCHSRPLKFTVTTHTDADGKETKTRKLAEDESSVATLNGNFPVSFQGQTGRMGPMLALQAKLKNGRFVHSLEKGPAPKETFHTDPSQGEGELVMRGPDSFTFPLSFTAENKLEGWVEGVYVRKKP